MIRGAAVAGAAAWTAPVIIDSLVSPAAAASACVKYFAKVAVGGASPNNCPGSGDAYVVTQASGTPGSTTSSTTFPVNGDKWGSSGSTPGGCGLSAGGNKISSVTADGAYKKVTLIPGCRFSASSLDWQIGARYGTSDPGDRYVKVQDRTTASGYGYFTDEGTTAWVQTAYPGGGSRTMQYIYLQFCCNS